MTPPRLADRLLSWFCAPHLREEVLGDLHERYALRVRNLGEVRARWRYWLDVLAYVRSEFIKRHPKQYPQPTITTMLRIYVKIAWRTLVKNKGYSAINIGGLAVGMAVAILIGLWVYDELSFNRSFANYDRLARVMLEQTDNGVISTSDYTPLPLSTTLKREYGSDFSHVAVSHGTGEQILTHGTKQLIRYGDYVEPEFLAMLPLTLTAGSRAGLNDPASILLSASLAKALFGQTDPLNKLIRIDNKINVNVTGVYQDFAANSSFRNYAYLLPWQQFVADQGWVQRAADNWSLNAFEVLVQLAPNAQLESLSGKIARLKATNAPDEAKFNPRLFLHP